MFLCLIFVHSRIPKKGSIYCLLSILIVVVLIPILAFKYRFVDYYKLLSVWCLSKSFEIVYNQELCDLGMLFQPSSTRWNNKVLVDYYHRLSIMLTVFSTSMDYIIIKAYIYVMAMIDHPYGYDNINTSADIHYPINCSYNAPHAVHKQQKQAWWI